MNTQQDVDVFPFDEFEQLREAREIVREAAQALGELSALPDSTASFLQLAVKLITACPRHRDRHRNGESRLNRPENRRHTFIDGNSSRFPASGRGRAWRPGLRLCG